MDGIHLVTGIPRESLEGSTARRQLELVAAALGTATAPACRTLKRRGDLGACGSAGGL